MHVEADLPAVGKFRNMYIKTEVRCSMIVIKPIPEKYPAEQGEQVLEEEATAEDAFPGGQLWQYDEAALAA